MTENPMAKEWNTQEEIKLQILRNDAKRERHRDACESALAGVRQEDVPKIPAVLEAVREYVRCYERPHSIIEVFGARFYRAVKSLGIGGLSAEAMGVKK